MARAPGLLILRRGSTDVDHRHRPAPQGTVAALGQACQPMGLCEVGVDDVADPLMQRIRFLDAPAHVIAEGMPTDKVLRA